MNLSNNDVKMIIEKINFSKAEIYLSDNMKKANKAFDFALRKICEIIFYKRLDLFMQLVNNREPTIIGATSLFLLPISEMKTFKRMFKLFFLPEYSTNAKTLWNEYKIKKRLKFPMLINNKIVYVSKDEYLKQFTSEEIKLIASGL